MKARVRESNFELLRLVCMFYILLHHFIAHGLRTAGYWDKGISVSGVIFNSLFVIAVNCFILISGYFGITASWRGFIQLYVITAFYILGFTLISFVYLDYFSLKNLVFSFLPFSHSPYWFITTYFYLFLLAPILNRVIRNLNKQEYMAALLLLTILNLYFGFFWEGSVNPNGYNLMNFIFLYFIAGFIALHTKNDPSRKQQRVYLSLYLLNSLLMAAVVIIVYHRNPGTGWIASQGYAYNNPFVVLSALFFFLLFRTFRFSNSFINQVAKSAIAIYLIHENPIVRGKLYAFVHQLDDRITHDWLLLILFPLLALLLMVFCIVTDRIRMYLTNPIETLLNKPDWGTYTDRLIHYFSVRLR